MTTFIVYGICEGMNRFAIECGPDMGLALERMTALFATGTFETVEVRDDCGNLSARKFVAPS